MGTIGKAISLGAVTKLPRSDYGFYDRFKQIQERKKTQEPAYDPYKDFVKIDKTLQPAWANELSKLGSETIKKIQDVRAKNPNNQAEIVRIMQEEYNPRASAIISGNTNALDYMTNALTKGYASQKVIHAIATGQSLDDIAKIISDEGDSRVKIDATGSFYGNAGSRYNPDKDKDTVFGDSDYEAPVFGKPQRVGETEVIIPERKLRQSSYESRVNKVSKDPSFRGMVYNYATPEMRRIIDQNPDAPEAQQLFRQAAEGQLQQVEKVKYGTPHYNEISRPRQSSSFTFNNSGIGTNERFSVEKIAPKAIQYQTTSKNGDVVAQYETGNGYSIKGLTEAENAPQYWSSSTAFNVETGKQERAFNKKGTLVGVMDSFNVLDKSGKVLREIKDPIAIVQVKNETASGKEKDVTYFIPYKNVKGEVKAYTADKKGAGGWELPKSNQQPSGIDYTKVKYRKKLKDGRIALGDANGKLIGYE